MKSLTYDEFVGFLGKWVTQEYKKIPLECYQQVEIEAKFGRINSKSNSTDFKESKKIVVLNNDYHMIPRISKFDFDRLRNKYINTKFNKLKKSPTKNSNNLSLSDYSVSTSLPAPLDKGRLRLNNETAKLDSLIHKEKISNILLSIPNSTYGCKISFNLEIELPKAVYINTDLDKCYRRHKLGNRISMPRSKNTLELFRVCTENKAGKTFENYEVEIELCSKNIATLIKQNNNKGLEKEIRKFSNDFLEIKNNCKLKSKK